MTSFGRNSAVCFEFHVSRSARVQYEIDVSLFSLQGNLIFANFRAARVLAQRMNARRDLLRHPERAVSAGQINSMGLIDEILHYVVALYREQKNPVVMVHALEWLNARLGREVVDAALLRFAEEFPPTSVYRGEITPDAYLRGQTAGVPHRQILLEELLMLWLSNANPGFDPARELFDDTDLASTTVYPQIVTGLHEFFETQPRFGPDNQNLIDMLRSPALASPRSLAGQLRFIRDHWSYLIGDFLLRLLSSLDLIQEEERPPDFGGPGPARVYEFGEMEGAPERFSPDRDWMPRVVLLAKNAYVWLDQLSKQYQRHISRLDQIPDDVLVNLARRGFTGLWLIGLWERSSASQRIKQLCGNPEAVASAYSIHDYVIAADLGGPSAFDALRERAWSHGIRMASDMVPNHMGIDSRWVMQHPGWFISLDYSPFPSYTFYGPDLSQDERVGIFLEDHYYTRTDAAVVFKRLDRWTGREQYIYHGNDGTRMPWNDTAQLDFLRPDVREAVIQTILHVARQFPIIRFDAAMTLAKQHYHRLWFPEPGTGGAIASRADHGMTRRSLDQCMPIEFWREVVDRVAAEAPDTLLLAEAFWLLEGYFVRTLGMHRVYNSAFMNMLRDEDNANYRLVIKNTLEFDPEIMKRYVNFMSNPDERTAVDQFGKDDKYFGICTLLATLPGLPMFGHGQIEGFAEQYGMEFRRAYWDERADDWFVARHEREIFPLLHRRYLFAGVENFRLYDLFTAEGWVNEDVFAFSNRVDGERGLVVYHNRYAEARGWIRTSVGYAVKSGGSEERRIVQTSLGNGLGLHDDPGYFCIFREQRTGLEYLRNSRDIFANGLYVELGAYKYQVYLDFREVPDTAHGDYARLAHHLNGRGVPSVEQARRELLLQPVLAPFATVVNREMFERILAARVARPDQDVPRRLLDDVEERLVYALGELRRFTQGTGDERAIARELRRELETILRLPSLDTADGAASSPEVGAAVAFLREGLDDDLATWGTLLGWLTTHALGRLLAEDDVAATSRGWLDELLLGKAIAGTLQELGLDQAATEQAILTIKILVSHQRWWVSPRRSASKSETPLERWLRDPDVRRYLQINRFQDILWLNKEALQRLLWWMLLIRAVDAGPDFPSDDAEARDVARWNETLRHIGQAAESAGYQVERWLDLVSSSQPRGERRPPDAELVRDGRGAPVPAKPKGEDGNA